MPTKLIIKLGLSPPNDLLLISLTPRLSISIDTRTNPRLDPLPCGDPNDVLLHLIIAKPLQHGALHRPQLEVVLRPHEVEHTQAIGIALIRRRHDDAVDTALEEAVGQHLQRVGHVDCDAPWVRPDPFPTAFWGADL